VVRHFVGRIEIQSAWRRIMKKTFIVALASALALSGSVLVSGARAESSTTTTEKTTTYKGTVSEVDPATSTIVVKSETTTAPTKYTYTKETVFTDVQGNVVTYEAVRNTPVTVYYTTDGDRTIVTKVVSTKPAAPAVETHKESTTTETKHEKY
jgi:hypothetical protein